MAKASAAARRPARKRGTKAQSGKRAKAAPAAPTKAARRPRNQLPRGQRYRVHYDIDGPRVRLGILWFLTVCAALATGEVVFGSNGARVGFSAVYGLCAAAAATQTARAWRRRGRRTTSSLPSAQAAGAGVLAVAVAAIFGPPVMGIGLLGFTGAIVALAVARSGAHPVAVMRDIGVLMQSALPPALAAGFLVLLADLELWAAIALFFLVSSYEIGDFIVGSGAPNSVEGPFAGVAAVVVTTIAVAALGIPPFDVAAAAAFGGSIAVLAPAGQLLASAMLPHAQAPAPALRRLDSLLLAAPLWYVGVDLYLL